MSKPTLTAEAFDMAYKGEQLRLALEAVQKDLGIRLQIGWKGKHAYLQAVDADNPTEHAITVFKVSKDGRMRWCVDDEAKRPVKYERAYCSECGTGLCEVKA